MFMSSQAQYKQTSKRSTEQRWRALNQFRTDEKNCVRRERGTGDVNEMGKKQPPFKQPYVLPEKNRTRPLRREKTRWIRFYIKGRPPLFGRNGLKWAPMQRSRGKNIDRAWLGGWCSKKKVATPRLHYCFLCVEKMWDWSSRPHPRLR